MSTIKDGGPAFPMPIAGCTDGCVYNALEQSRGELGGMTLRDYFAAKATDEDVKAAISFGESWEVSEDRARARFRHADAMLRAREVQS